MSGKMKKIDDNLLHQQLVGSVHEERLYNIRNEAKIRAVVSAKSYDEFKDIVATAHLTPLTKSDKQSAGKQRWNKAL